MFKKLVISERVNIIVASIWGNPSGFAGLWNWVALLLYPVVLYTDFSGCMDIVIGSAELFGIHMEENFKNPFLSRTIREFWTRWHITLGKWAKDYIMFPILKSSPVIHLSKKCKHVFGKHVGKFIPAAFASAMVWLVMGIWHGDVKYIVGLSLFYWVLIELGEFLDPYWERLLKKFQIRTDNFSWRFFQRARTYIIFSFGLVFFHTADVPSALQYIRSLFSIVRERTLNPWIFFDGSILNTRVSYLDINIIIIGVILLILATVLREKYGYARNWIAKQGLVFRWSIWIGLFTIILVYGMYGPGHEVAEFIYQGF